MKVLLDTNIIIDIALERQPYVTNSETVLAFVEKRQIEGYISASTISDLYYIIRKQKGRNLTIEFLQEILTFCQIATVNQTVITMAFTTNFKDFEDAIQYSTAVVNQLDGIITRNPQDFPVVTPRIITPEQLIEELTNSL
ncbi:type II toxin-antitoxin system VapC family toxin [Dolichospermum flos-aquae]|uniref:PIN domain-containing protein n=1 Tax=Dolichospermum flos-aquae CCAP 1403/13F TaxID=315271 RepID=A0A6H2BY41_DOLFA|nr:PIN domain-containing protein [Dolichospermum flos-aquae]QJB44492.1 PIN domain-containing protein [Dolichospermum flos-aquae CCAP 1403/13F]